MMSMQYYDQGPICGVAEEERLLSVGHFAYFNREVPAGAGFKIGGDSGINYLVFQVHYNRQQDPNYRDHTRLIINTLSGKNHAVTRQAHIWWAQDLGTVPVGESEMAGDCEIYEDKLVHPFMYLLHTHGLGTKVSLYKKPAGDSSEMVLIREGNPQEAQIYYPIEDTSLFLGKGDRLSLRCEFHNTRNETVYVGSRRSDEMCMAYMMYWVEGEKGLGDRHRFCPPENMTLYEFMMDPANVRYRDYVTIW